MVCQMDHRFPIDPRLSANYLIKLNEASSISISLPSIHHKNEIKDDRESIRKKRRRKLLIKSNKRVHSNNSTTKITTLLLIFKLILLMTTILLFFDAYLLQQHVRLGSTSLVVEAAISSSLSSLNDDTVVVDTDYDFQHYQQLNPDSIHSNWNQNQKKIKSKELLKIRPLIKINNNKPELILQLSLPNSMTESLVLNNSTRNTNINNQSITTLNLKLTAIQLDKIKTANVNNNHNTKFKSSVSLPSSSSFKIDFLSENFIYTEQKSVYNSNETFHETIQLTNNNPTEYYTNNVIGQLLESSSGNQRQQCQLFKGFIDGISSRNNNNTVNNWQNDSFATITICNDGSMNALVTLSSYGQIVLEYEKIAQKQLKNKRCQINKKSNLDTNNTANKNNSILVLEVCSHHLKFIRFPSLIEPNNNNRNNLEKNYEDNKVPMSLVDNRQQKIKNQEKKEKTNRKKRSYSSERTIEILLVTDLSMYVYHGNSLRNYVFTLMAMVSHLFKHSSIGNEINLKLVKLTSLVDEKQEKNWFGSAHKTLRHFCRWQYEHNHPSDDHPLHYDTAILLTKIDLCSKNEFNFNEIDGGNSRIRSSCDTLGLAHSGQICDPESSCAIVEDNGLSAAFTIAHELGHLLGVPHDDEERCKKYYLQTETPRRQEFNVMVRMIDSTSHMWSWSSCSKHFITEFLDSGHGDCLLDNNAVDVRHSSEVRVFDTYQRRSFLQNWIDKLAKLPAGALYSADEQCRLVFDKNSSICLDMPYCKKLWCTTSNIGGCRTQHMPWADGTECGNGYWCQEGECVRVNRAHLRPIDGGWGEWSPWSECSLSCGGGIRKSRRECDNPSPKFGGKFCIGERVKYESCNLEPCPYQTNNNDARAQQCAEFNTYNLTWTPKYTGISTPDLCALYCESSSGESHKLKSRVVDGTPCSPDSYDICVNGKCLNAGCDRILGSNRHTDYCGVCGGDNSTCREISGQFKPRSVSHGYTFVLSIPPGATNVEIVKEPSIASDNWLALRGEYGEYLLNGRFTVNVYERKWYYGGTTVDYSGTKRHGFERINISRPIRSPLHLEVLCVGELHVPIINYHYVVTSDNSYVNYQWVSETEWSQCNKACNGEQERKPYCVAILHPSWLMDNSQPMITETKVNDEYCDYRTRPDIEYRVCNAHCELEWHIYQIGACSVKCGHGFRSRQVNCTQTFINHSERIYIDDFYCFHLGPKPSDKENCTADECRVTYQWQYTDWSACALHQTTCGSGQQTRVAHCLSTTYLDSDPLNVIHSNVGQELCSQHLPEPPVTVRSCQVECPHWNVEPWSECSGTCGKSGQRKRTITCMHGDQQVIDAYCETLETKPIDIIECEMADCLRMNSVNNYYQIDLQQHPQKNQSKMHNQEVSFFNSAESMINNEIIYHNMGLWQSGDWSSCELFQNHLEQFQNHLTASIPAPECFESNDHLNSFRERYSNLFRFNNSLYSNSYAELALLLNMHEQDLLRRRYVACVLPNSQHVLSDEKCDRKNRPKSEENCPLDDRIIQSMSKFDIKLCPTNNLPSTPLTTVDSISYEIEPKSNHNNLENSSYFNHYKIYENIKWTTTEWSDCFCDPEKKILIKKRMIICVRSVDSQTISEEYCLHNQLIKPNDWQECHGNHHSRMNCDLLFTSSTPNSTETVDNIEDVLNTNSRDPQQSALLPSHSHYSYYSSEPIVNITPSLSQSISTTSKPPIMSSSIISSSSSSSSLPVIPVQTSHQTSAAVYEQTELPFLSSSYSLPSSSTSNDHIESSTKKPIVIQTPIPNQIIYQPMNNGWTEWTEWSECSVSCGNGNQSREPRCPNGQKCDPKFKPQKQYRSCYRMCGFFQWHYSEWSPCSVSCGPGFRSRNAECRDWTGFPVPDRFCKNEKLTLKEQCRMMDCKLVWRSGQWSECSQQCGPGIQTRTVTCHRINKYGVIDPEPMDRSNSILRRKRKENFKSKRKSKQRKKFKNLVYSKNRRNRQIIPQHYHEQWCNLDNKPSSKQVCNLGNCLQSNMVTDAYVWRTFDWQMCSTPCGFGYQRRKVYCYSQRTNSRVDRSRCDPKLKPDKRRQCNLRSCEVISCLDRRDRARTRIDGEYELWIQGAMIRVYCYGMDYLPKPLEYLILNENTFDDNYSQLTIGSSDCSRYSSHVNHRRDLSMRKISLRFRYVRFDVSTLRIFANDTRYAVVAQDSTTAYSNSLIHERLTTIGFGQAFVQGCPLAAQPSHSMYQHTNSINNCQFAINNQKNKDVDNQLKSIFSINLQKTGLIVDPDNQWIIIGDDYGLLQKNIQISRNGEKIIGHCNFRMDKLPITVPTKYHNCLIGCQPIDNIIKVRIP